MFLRSLRWLVAPAFVLAVAGSGNGVARAQDYETIFLTLPTGATTGAATAISDGQIVGYSGAFVGNARALLWSVADPTRVTDLGASYAYGVGGGQQVGITTGLGLPQSATLWRGTPDSRTSLQPDALLLPGFLATQSQANATDGRQQVGWAFGADRTGTVRNHALLWSGTASSAVDLNPSGFFASEANGVRDGQQVGFGETQINFSSTRHALLWTGSADSAVDLHPTSFASSTALATDGRQQAGFGQIGSSPFGATRQALLWSGTAASVVNLHPVSGFDSSSARAARNGKQVGTGTLAGGGFSAPTHALFWSGSAQSMVDLHAFLPAGVSSSSANGIDAFGNIVGTADGRPVLWRPRSQTAVPEPGTCALWATGLLPLFAAVRRRRRRRCRA